jgi:hypothetical protein
MRVRTYPATGSGNPFAEKAARQGASERSRVRRRTGRAAVLTPRHSHRNAHGIGFESNRAAVAWMRARSTIGAPPIRARETRVKRFINLLLRVH